MTEGNEKSLKHLLEALSAVAGCDVPEAEEDGRYLLELDDGLGVALMPASNEGDEDDGALVVSFVLGTIANASPEFLAEILEANYMWALSANGSFAIEAESGQVVLQRAFPLPTDPKGFVESFGQLAGAAREYGARLSGGGAASSAGMSSPGLRV